MALDLAKAALDVPGGSNRSTTLDGDIIAGQEIAAVQYTGDAQRGYTYPLNGESSVRIENLTNFGLLVAVQSSRQGRGAPLIIRRGKARTITRPAGIAQITLWPAGATSSFGQAGQLPADWTGAGAPITAPSSWATGVVLIAASDSPLTISDAGEESPPARYLPVNAGLATPLPGLEFILNNAAVALYLPRRVTGWDFINLSGVQISINSALLRNADGTGLLGGLMTSAQGGSGVSYIPVQAGQTFSMDADFSPWLGTPGTGTLIWSFVASVAAGSASCILIVYGN